jgi:single-strand DNA-binding protein
MNTLTLTGHLVRDPKLTEGSTDRAFFTIAIDRPGSDGGTDFIGITCFAATARAVAQHIGKGHLVAIQGRLRSNRYEQDGQTIHSLDVIANRVEFLNAPNGSGATDGLEPANAGDEEPF